jgi:hypothetical protein
LPIIKVVLTLLLCASLCDAQVYRRAGRKTPAPPAGGNYAFVSQVENSDNATGTSSVVSPAISVTAGNLLIAVVFFDAAANPTGTLSSSPSNTWTQLASGVHDGSQYGMRAYYSYNSASGSTVVTWTGSSSYPAIYVAQFSGIRSASQPLTGTPVFANQATPGTGANGVTSGNTTPAGQPALVFGFALDVPSSGGPASGTGYTGLTAVWDWDGAAPISAKPEHKRVTATDATAATFTAAYNERHFSFVAAFLEP